ncbi:MAG TPA: diol dehydratase small subunit [Gaiellaceae bacterium]|nr:diol dehydratase small subunit [Gaiellaceae bacterium]
MAFDPRNDYPLGSRRPDLVTTRGGLPLADVTLETVRSGTIAADEIRATPATLSLQADVARAAGRSQLAANLDRAAELAVVPDELLLDVYTALRPRRATAEELEGWAAKLEGLEAVKTAAFVREAAAAYAQRGLLADA